MSPNLMMRWDVAVRVRSGKEKYRSLTFFPSWTPLVVSYAHADIRYALDSSRLRDEPKECLRRKLTYSLGQLHTRIMW